MTGNTSNNNRFLAAAKLKGHKFLFLCCLTVAITLMLGTWNKCLICIIRKSIYNVEKLSVFLSA